MTAGKRNRALASIAVFILMLFLGWYAGCDYTERGFKQAVNLMIAIVAGGAWWFITGIFADLRSKA